jgi:hypothetical protein
MTVKTPVAMVAALLAVLVFSAAPALAAAPEAPVTEAPAAIAGTAATFKGELVPGVTSEKVTYYFAYSPGVGASCTESGMRAPGEPFPEAEDNEKVSVPVTGLEGSTTYAVCLLASNAEGETTGSQQTFKTLASRPVVVSETATAITPFDGSLEAVLNPERRVSTYYFEYAATKLAVEKSEGTSFGESSIPAVSEAQGTGPVDIGGGLTPATTYYYRVLASSANGATDGPVESFETEPLVAPSIDAESVTGATQTSAELHALINPEYQETKYQFEVGTDTSYGLGPVLLSEGELSASFGENPVAVNLAPQEGVINTAIELQPNTEYHYEAVATNGTGTSEGLTTLGVEDETFLTLPNPPTVSTGGFSGVTTSTATISGSVDPGSSGFPTQDDTKYYFQYGTTTGYGHQAPGLLDHTEAEACREDLERDEACPAESEAGEGESTNVEESSLVSLQPGVTYHYRIVATNDNASTDGGLPQTVYGQDETFTTTATPPIFSEVSVQGIGQNSATISATLDPQGLATRWELQLGVTPRMLQPADTPCPGDATAACLASGDTSSPLALNIPLLALTPGTTYYYKLVAVNPSNEINLETNQQKPTETLERSFTTAPAAGLAPGALPGLIPYQSIAALNAKEAQEDKKLPGPTKTLTNAEKLKKALNACKKKKGTKRTKCETTARKKYPTAKARRKAK